MSEAAYNCWLTAARSFYNMRRAFCEKVEEIDYTSERTVAGNFDGSKS